MKKLLVLAVIFAFVASFAFAEAAVSGQVIGTFNLLQGSNEKDANDDAIDPNAGGSMSRVRVEVSGGDEDGTFGGWVRLEDGMVGNAWWKPMDALLVRLGSNGGDGFWGKEGVTGWMFYQTATDTGVTYAGENVWGWGGPGNTVWGWNEGHSGFGTDLSTRNAFYGGFDNGLMLEIKPMDILTFNIGIPFAASGEFGDIAGFKGVYGGTTIQADLNLDFGNIALTFVGNRGTFDGDVANAAQVFAYLGMGIGENMALDVGIGFPIPVKEGEGDTEVTYHNPIGIGVGFKFSGDAFGVKARAALTIAGSAKYKSATYNEPMGLLLDVMPFIAINDSATLFISLGVAYVAANKQDDFFIDEKAYMAWHFNPYLQIGSEWGPKFLAGIKLWSPSKDHFPVNGSDAALYWAIPIALNVGF